MNEEYNKPTKQLMNELLNLGEWCAQNDTDNCEIEIGSKLGKIKVKIDFEIELNNSESEVEL